MIQPNSYQHGHGRVLRQWFVLCCWVLGACQFQPAAVIDWQPLTTQELQRAKAAQLPVLVYFHATWCASCRALDEQTFQDTKVKQTLQHFVTLHQDVTELNAANHQLLADYGVTSLPAGVFVDKQGVVLQTPRLYGFVSPKHFLSLLVGVSLHTYG